MNDSLKRFQENSIFAITAFCLQTSPLWTLVNQTAHEVYNVAWFVNDDSEHNCNRKCACVVLFDDESLEFQADIEFGIFVHSAQLDPHRRTCNLFLASIDIRERDFSERLYCAVRTMARLTIGVGIVEMGRESAKRSKPALADCVCALANVGYSARYFCAIGERAYLIAVPFCDEAASAQLEQKKIKSVEKLVSFVIRHLAPVDDSQ